MPRFWPALLAALGLGLLALAAGPSEFALSLAYPKHLAASWPLDHLHRAT